MISKLYNGFFATQTFINIYNKASIQTHRIPRAPYHFPEHADVALNSVIRGKEDREMEGHGTASMRHGHALLLLIIPAAWSISNVIERILSSANLSPKSEKPIVLNILTNFFDSNPARIPPSTFQKAKPSRLSCTATVLRQRCTPFLLTMSV